MASSNGSRHNSKLSAIPAVAVPGRSVVAVERDRCKWDFVHPIYVKPPREQHALVSRPNSSSSRRRESLFFFVRIDQSVWQADPPSIVEGSERSDIHDAAYTIAPIPPSSPSSVEL